MNPNLHSDISTTFSYKHLLLRKLSYAVTSSVISQLFILLFYVFFTNISLLHPLEWLGGTLQTMTSFSTWIFTMPFLTIIFAQSLICAKDYVIKTTYYSSRFQKILATFSVHNLVSLTLHVIVGATLIWLFLSISGGQYQNLIERCDGKKYCLNEGSFFLILGGFWIGLYFFLKVYITEKNLTFPVASQRKFLELKSNLGKLAREAVGSSFLPSLYFSVFYYFQGAFMKNSFKDFFGLLDYQEEPTIFIYLYLWFFNALYFVNMNLMRFYFNLFLTEPVQFSLVKHQPGSLTLEESIANYDWPIVQNLACLDLHLLALMMPERRRVFYQLSNPGGHPHKWNSLVDTVLKLLTEYTGLLNRTIDVPENKPQIIQVPVFQSPDRFRNLRNMSLIDYDDDCDYITIADRPTVNIFEILMSKVSAKMDNAWSYFKSMLGINFWFGDLPQANIQKCFANGRLIIWASQGIANMVRASLEEDEYGIVQKDLPVIITNLVQLKQTLDKFNKVIGSTKNMAGYDDFSYRMKGAVTSAVTKSLFNICRSFNDYLQEIPLKKDVFLYLQVEICKK